MNEATIIRRRQLGFFEAEFNMPSSMPQLPQRIWKTDPSRHWLNETRAHPERLLWTIKQHLWAKLSSLLRVGRSNKLCILWGLGMHQSGPSGDPVLVCDPILRPRKRDGLDNAIITKHHLRDVNDLACEGLIVVYEVEPEQPGETNLGTTLADSGDTHINVPNSSSGRFTMDYTHRSY